MRWRLAEPVVIVLPRGMVHVVVVEEPGYRLLYLAGSYSRALMEEPPGERRGWGEALRLALASAGASPGRGGPLGEAARSIIESPSPEPWRKKPLLRLLARCQP